MESTFFHLSAEKIQWLDMEWMQAGARSPQFPGDNIQHSQPYYFPLLIMSLSRSRSPRSPRTSVHNCCDVSVPQSERQVKRPHNVLVKQINVSFHFFKWLLIILQVRWWRMSEVSPGISWLHQPQPLLQISVREAPWSVGEAGGVILGNTRGIFEYSHLITSHSSQISDQLRFMQIKQ